MQTTSRKLPTKRQKLFMLKRRNGRNDAWYDLWSLLHFITGVLFGWIMPPFVALVIMILWEPLEIMVLSPILAHYDINFGYETFRNSLSDIMVDVAGVATGYYVLQFLVTPPLHLF